MGTLEFTLQRNVFRDTFTLGRMLVNGTQHLGYTCEDADRELEKGGFKIPKQTAIPRGRYRLTATYSNRFGRIMPIIEGVNNFSGIRVHGGNDSDDTEGCPLLGAIPTAEGVKSCKEVNEKFLQRILDAESLGQRCWITVQ